MIDCSEFNVQDKFKPLPLDCVKTIQKINTLPYAVAAINLCGSLNLGMMIRSAVIFGCERFYIIGRKRYDKRSTVGAHNYIDLKFLEKDCNIENEAKEILQSIESNYTPCFIEQGGKDIDRITFAQEHFKPCFIFGSESNGIPKHMMTQTNKVYSIPQLGVLRSLNVSAAASIIMHKAMKDLK